MPKYNNNMKYIHCVLRQDKTTLETYLNYDARVKIGVSLTLKDQDGWWIVDAMGDSTELPESAKHNSESWYKHDELRKMGKLKLE
jgi:hypothetical protein